ncbi:DNA polymerase III subunit beta family protein [Micromonospora zhanjiangensis]|uniref:MerR family transcriptional regulator n=1 Tax=Micromonospora zhanjiangensis TaxID=1522057 RepID=A0ABV8KI14_9ACTN
MRGIGEMARATGLTVSALRFYDGAGVLVPAEVDRVTGYRRYAPEQVAPGRMLASLRRVGMPLADINRVLAARADPATVRELLDAHLRRLEDGLADARRELARVRTHLDRAEHPTNGTRITVSAADLAAAVDAVRFAVGTDPELPMLGGVLFEADPDGLRLVATDRYRLALAVAPVRELTGPPIRVLAPADLVDRVRALLTGGEVVLTVAADGFDARCRAGAVAGEPLEFDFPDYRRLVRDRAGTGTARRVTVDVAELRRTLAGGTAPVLRREAHGTSYEVTVLAVAGDGRLTILDEAAAAGSEHVAVNREFLLDALDAGGHGQLVLELDGPIAPLAIRTPAGDRTLSMLMPVRLS